MFFDSAIYFARFSTDLKYTLFSSLSDVKLTPYFFFNAIPSSNASIESSPKPSVNKGALESMSATVMSSKSLIL